MALNALERYEESIDCCTRCLDFDPTNKVVEAAKEKADKAKAIKDAKERKRQEEIRRAQEKKRKMTLALRVSVLKNTISRLCAFIVDRRSAT